MRSICIKILRWTFLITVFVLILYISTLEPYFFIRDVKNVFNKNQKSFTNEVYDNTDAILPDMQGYPERDRKMLEMLLDSI